MNVAYVFISHDLSVVRHIADDVMVMYLGRVAEKGPTEEIFAKPLHPYTRALLASAPKIDPTQRVKTEPLTEPATYQFSETCCLTIYKHGEAEWRLW